ncbi:MAG TPA: hypothetical protein VFV49_12450, partial [Thermoanaerobaculia bacterium]|nr:hypothetical protein [Thermoanaerobaculia bacterium]
MSRHRFGLWGIELDEKAFAEALAGAALVEVRKDVAVLELTQIPPPMPAAVARTKWQRAGAKRIEVKSRGHLDLLWLNAMLAQVACVYFRRDEPDVAVAWEWPLRIGLLEDDRGSELQQSLGDSSLQQIVRFVTLTETVTECELLLIPCNLRTSVARVLTAPARITADCVIVMGGAKADSDRVAALLHTLRTEVRTAGVAVASVPKEKRHDWLHALVAQLAHNKTIDDALQLAAGRDYAPPPLLVCSGKLAELARVARYVERVGTALRRMAPNINSI